MVGSEGSDEVLAHLAPDGPVAAAWWWLRELVEGDATAAWTTVTTELGRVVDLEALRHRLRLPLGGWASLGASRAPSPMGVDLELVTIYERGPLEDAGMVVGSRWPLALDVPAPPEGPVPWLQVLMRRDGAAWSVAGLDGEGVTEPSAPLPG